MRSSRNPLLALAFVGSVFTIPALAQQPASSSYPAACETSRVSKSDVERAHTVFLSGKQYLEESNYEKAISYFKDAYSIDCSIHAILPIIATAYERKGDKGEAVLALEEYQRRAPTAPDHEVIDRRIHNLKDQLAKDQAAAAPIATASAAPTAAPTASVEVAPPAPSSGTASPGGATSSGGHRVEPWILVGLGGAAVVAGVAVFASGHGDVSTAEGQCNAARGCSSPAVAAQGNKGRSLENAGGAVGAIGIVAIGAGLIWHFVEKPPPASGAALVVSPVVTPAYGGVVLGGAF